MKLSEILAKPIKVKGGGILNLKGISKHIVDKEIGGGGAEQDDVDVFAKYGCVDVMNMELNPDPALTYIKLVVGDRNKRVTITPDDFIKYQSEVQNLINNHQEAGDLNSHILVKEQFGVDSSTFEITIFDLIPSSLSNIEIDTEVDEVSDSDYRHCVPIMPKFYADNDIIQEVHNSGIVPNAYSMYGSTIPINLHGLCFIALNDYFGIKKPAKLSMPALYIDIDAMPTEDYKIPAKFVWVTIENISIV